MKKLKKWITSPAATIALFAVAAGLLLFTTIGSARAALRIFSDTYKGRVELQDIGVTLLEKSGKPDSEARPVASRDYKSGSQDEWEGNVEGVLLENLLAEGEVFVPGKAYTEEISCANTGTIDEYVRITIYKYWTDSEGNKVLTKDKESGLTTQELTPELIRFTFPNEDCWILDSENSAETEERQIYYYNKLLKAGTDTKDTPLTGTLTIDESVTRSVSKVISDGGKTITTSYDYDGWKFCVEATVDAVQDHNAEDAIRSAWGRDVTVSDGTLSLN
ncbi:MAG: hypothetical protein UHU21_09480 [Lachnospiraceae bacterium]|nr:hypothetical protein [Lachnospiraceae bacterium]